MTKKKIIIEVWSDFMCPFCYMGKQKLERGLSKFDHKEIVEVVWRSYQLAPDLVTDTSKKLDVYFAERKGISLDEAIAINNDTVEKAKLEGLTYNLDKAIPPNTFQAHQMSHFAMGFGKQNEAEEVLFRSYFTDGKNIDDRATLLELAEEIGLDSKALNSALENETFANNVLADREEAKRLGIRMIPCFVVNGKESISGTYNENTFLEALNRAYQGKEAVDTFHKKDDSDIIEGDVCTIDGDCS